MSTHRKSQPTPGPWFLAAATMSERPLSEWVVEGSKSELIAVMADHRLRSQTEADARLISAAPDLLEALKAIAEGTEEENLMTNARAAIAKAVGK